MTERRYLTATEVSDVLGITPRHVRRLALKGRLPYETKLPGGTGVYLFNPEEVARLVAEVTPS